MIKIMLLSCHKLLNFTLHEMAVAYTCIHPLPVKHFLYSGNENAGENGPVIRI
jgi:hypothetical protein